MKHVITAVWRDGNDTPVLARPMLQANLDIVLLSFIVKDGKVEDTAGAQFGNNQDLIDKTGKVPLVGPIKIQIGAPAGSNLTEGSPPNQITIIAQRGADSGTGVISMSFSCFFL